MRRMRSCSRSWRERSANGNGRSIRPCRWTGRLPADWSPSTRSTPTSRPRWRCCRTRRIRARRVTCRLAGGKDTGRADCSELCARDGSGRRRASTARASFSSTAISRGSTATDPAEARSAPNDPTVTYDDAYTMAAWIYPTAPSGAIVTRDEDVFEPNGHGLNLRDGRIEYDVVTKWVDEGIRLRTEKAISLNQWHHVALTYDGSRWAAASRSTSTARIRSWRSSSTTSTARAR